MFEVVVTARVANPALITGWQTVGALVIHTALDRLTAERLVEQPGLLLVEYRHARDLLLTLYPQALVGTSVRKVV